MKFKVVLSNTGEYELGNVERSVDEPTQIVFVPATLEGVTLTELVPEVPDVIPFRLRAVGADYLNIPKQYLRSYDEVVEGE